MGKAKKAEHDKQLELLQVQAALMQRNAERHRANQIEKIPVKMRPFSFLSYANRVRLNFQDGDQSKIQAMEICDEFAKYLHVEKRTGQDEKPIPYYNLVITGNVGAGKTGLAIPILLAAIYQGANVGYIDFTTFINESRMYSIDVKSQAVDNFQKLDVVVIDDLGIQERMRDGKLREAATDSIEVASQIINYRTQRCLPTVVVSNLNLYGLREQFGQRLYSRLNEASEIVWVGGRDMRLDAS